jgi:ATP-dependent RNA helicase DDX49/DBP8
LEESQHQTANKMAPSSLPESVSRESSVSSDVSDGEIKLTTSETQARAPKRRRLSVSPDSDSDTAAPAAPLPLPSLSRIKKKSTAKDTQTPASEENPVLIKDALEIGLSVEESSFKALNVAPWLVGSLTTMAVRKPTAIQKACIPEILRGRDCIGGSRTGSGKTIAFAVPILQKWAEDPFGIFAVILTPTRYVWSRISFFIESDRGKRE